MIVAGSASPLLLASAGAYNIQRSLRFRSSASAFLSRTPASAGNRKTWTWSAWVKRGAISTGVLFSNNNGAANNGHDEIYFDSNHNLIWASTANNASLDYYLVTSQVFRDPSAYYHIVASIDTTQATSSNRLKLYVNGVQISSFSTASYPSLNYDGMTNRATNTTIGVLNYTGAFGYFDGYLAEVNFIDGQALTPSSFGENNAQTGVWQPKRYTGTYGTNGFYLPFSDNSSTTTLTQDRSGNGNNWTANNISLTSGTTYDSMTDVPTLTSATQANYCVINPINKNSNMVISNGNLTITGSAGTYPVGGSMVMPTGKWYAEFTVATNDGGGYPEAGIMDLVTNVNTNQTISATLGVGYTRDGRIIKNGTTISSSAGTFTNGDVIGIAFDSANRNIWFSKNGTWVLSGDPSNGTSPATTANAENQGYVFAASCYSSASGNFNFGQRPFAYTPPTGFVALNTFNLPTPTIGATASTQANKYFDPVLWTGNGSSTRTITGLNFQPDFVWAKVRNAAGQHTLQDAVRGSSNQLSSNSTSAEVSSGSNGYGYVTSFTSDGFSTTAGSVDNSLFNANSATYVAWNWNAGGSTVTNTSGSISSQVRANPSAGFSIVTYTSNNTGGATVGHGLGVRPSMIILKRRSAVSDWDTYHISLGATRGIALNTTAAAVTNSNYWNNTEPTSTVFTLGAGVNPASTTMVAYCFAEVAGYSRFGSYTGNGSSDGTFVHLGFRPRYVLIKMSSSTSDWWVVDSSRSPTNVATAWLNPNLSNAESTPISIDLVSNGFKFRSAAGNDSGSTWIYMAFAENPFKYSLAR